MIFSPDLAIAVLEGRKTVTRRRIKGDSPCRYRPGKTYAVQPGRGKASVGRILVESVDRESVWNISDQDVIAEGFSHRDGFYRRWSELYGQDPPDECWVIRFRLVEEVE